MTIRMATAADIDEMVRLRILFLDEVNGPGRQPEGYAGKLRSYLVSAMEDGSFAAFLAEEDGTIAATSGVCFYHIAPNYSNPSGGTAYILNMYTLPEYRRRGLASELFAKVIEEARERGYTRLALHATQDGRKVYEKFGFETKGDEMVLNISLLPRAVTSFL